MGADDFGDLGVGGASAKGKQVDGAVHVVDLRTQDVLGNTPAVTVSIKSVVTGPHNVVVHLIALDEDGRAVEYLMGWGTSRHGQLGDWKDSNKGHPIPFISSPRSLPLPQENCGILQVAMGTHHTVVLHPSGRVSALGSNRKGQLAALEDLQAVSNIGCTWNGTYAIVGHEDSWSVVSIGSHTKGQLGRHLAKEGAQTHVPGNVCFSFSQGTHRLSKLACGSEHVLALFKAVRDASQPSHTEVWGWGWNEHGNLGLGHTVDQELPVRLWPPPLAMGHQPQAVDVWAGCGTSWILLCG
ncbi:RCC1/BLIP-II [Cytidiella melzeri]|nr:RCC1/BLIP-II [Cytidiella melzeri]